MPDSMQDIADAFASGQLCGKLSIDAPLKRYTWFRTGGNADFLFEPADCADLQKMLSLLPEDVPVTVIGVGSNLLVRDGGVRGVVVRLGAEFDDIQIDGVTITAGAAAMDAHVAKKAADADITGLEYLVGVPGTIGGALAMNAGAYGGELAQHFISAEAIARDGSLCELGPDDFNFSYRQSGLPDGLIITKVIISGKPGNGAHARARMAEIMAERADSQPIGTRTGGSTFKNPDGYKAWQLVDKAGGRGMRVGGAQISEKHCNFMINTGGATADDIERLGEDIRRRVANLTGVQLEWEIRRIGDFSIELEGL